MINLEKVSELTPREKSNDEIINSIKSSRYTDDPALTLLSVGRALASINEWDLACEAFRQALLRDPTYAEAWAFLGEALQHLDNRPATDQHSRDGLQEIQTAIVLNPDSLSAHLFLSLYWTRLGRYEPALDAMEKAIKLDSNNPLLYAELAKIQAISGDNENAHHSYIQAIALAPEDPSFIRGLIEFSIAYDYQINEVALPAARRLLIDFQSDAINYDLFAQVMIKLGDLANAERFLKRALAIDPELGVVHLHLGLVYILQSEDEKAFHELNLALSLSPDPYDPVADQAQRLLHNHFAQ